MRFTIQTLGCKVNAYESEYYTQQLAARGHIQDDENPDLCIINTCTVTNTAAAKSRQMVHRARKNYPQAKIAVVGCFVETAEESEKQKLEADLLIGARGKSRLADQAEALFSQTPRLTDEEEGASFESMPIKTFAGRHRAFLKIQDGCNQFCSYCAIPFARGRERSLSFDEAVRLGKELAENGHKEIVLTGIHTGRFNGMDKTGKERSLADLLKELLKETDQDVCYRISSIEITEVDDALIELMKEDARLLHHLHIPIQSGSDPVLKAMNRPYTVQQFKDRIAWIRQQIPDISISTDIITGFPGETDEQAETTEQNLADIGFSFLHIFPYSRRKGTEAAEMKDHVHGTVQKARAARLQQLSRQLRAKDMARFDYGTVLTEQRHADYITGYTSQYHPVRIYTEKQLPARVSGKLIPKQGYYILEEFDAPEQTV